MTKAALLVGINYYNTPNKLNGCIGDIINMRNMLIDAYGYNPANIVMLHDSNDPKIIKAKGLPTGMNIINNLYTLAMQSGSLEEIWFHYSGHGAQLPDVKKIKDEDIDDVIVPVDFMKNGVLVDDDIYRLVKLIKCRGILLFDSCHSGSVCDLPWSFECFPNSYNRTHINSSVLANKNIFMFSGCKDDQTSADTYDSVTKTYVGAFTRAFLECLRSSGHSIPFITLHRNICTYLSQHGYSQIPLFASSTSTPHYVLSRASAVSPVNTPVPSKIMKRPPPKRTISMQSIMNV